MINILIVDDEKDIIQSLSDVLTDYRILPANNTAQALAVISKHSISVAFIDIMLGEEDGNDLLQKIRLQDSHLICIMMSGFASTSKVVESIKLGAFDYIEKPLSFQKVHILIENAIKQHDLKLIHEKEISHFELIGNSPSIQTINTVIEKAALSDFPVLISGPSGSGKEHVAHLTHLKSSRASQEIIKLNCAAIPGELFESELFGYQKGAFTGANRNRPGKLVAANHGTLFLDEIGELPLEQQAKLLRVLEDKKVCPVGSEKEIPVDFRLICATNRNLKEEIRQGNFREDLYYRIGVILIEIPQLNERKTDIPVLVRHFLKTISLETGNPEKQISPQALAIIEQLPLKGNIRELKNLIQRLTVFSEHSTIQETDFIALNTSTIQPPLDELDEIFQTPLPYSEAKHYLERKYLLTQLRLHNGNISETARTLHLIPNNLMRKIKQLGIQKPEFDR